jgi:U3 small nucleolar RNA-associated protein 24
MGKSKAKKTRAFGATKRMIAPGDPRLKANKAKHETKMVKRQNVHDDREVKNLPKMPTQLFFKYNTKLGPPYRILIDTNFINFSIKNKLDVFTSFMDCLVAKCIPTITECVMAELEKLGSHYRVALRIARDPRFEFLPCTHKGTYADDCLVRRVQQHKIYIVATCDKDLRRRLRKVPGVPIMYISARKYSIERFPDVNQAPAN